MKKSVAQAQGDKGAPVTIGERNTAGELIAEYGILMEHEIHDQQHVITGEREQRRREMVKRLRVHVED